jgi:hypothetical protein
VALARVKIMMRQTKITVVVIAFAAGCQVVESPTASDVQQGLSLFSQSRDKGLTGMYAEGDTVVFFETVTQPVTQEIIDHYASHGLVMMRPNFASRWTDAEGRAITQDGDWPENAEFAAPEKWETTLDLTRKASGALAEQVVSADVQEEQEYLVRVAAKIPEASLRVAQPSATELAQIAEREASQNYLGYSWRSYYYVRKPSGVNLHQGSSWDNHRYYSGAWHYYNNKVISNDVASPDYECSGIYSNVQDYKSYASSDSSIQLGGNGRCYHAPDSDDNGEPDNYGTCSLPWENKYNCRSEALRQQVWVLGDVACYWHSGMCATSQGFNGAYCGIRTSCSSRGGC